MEAPILTRKLTKAILLSPVSIVIGAVLSIALVDIFGTEPDVNWTFEKYVGNVMSLSVFGLPFAYGAVLVIGWPLHKLLSKFGLTSYWYYVLTAIGAGTIFAYSMARYNFQRWYVLSIVCAVVVASTFWALVREPKNDTDAI